MPPATISASESHAELGHRRQPALGHPVASLVMITNVADLHQRRVTPAV